MQGRLNSRTKDPLDELVALSNHFGSDPGFVIAGGGNTSAKIGDKIYVKASGVSLKSITRKGFVALDRRAVRASLFARYSRDVSEREEQVKNALLSARCEPEEGLRPSVESALHELMDYRFVVHAHPTLVNGMTCSVFGKQVAADLFDEDWIWIDYCNPGYALAKTTERAIAKHKTMHGKCPKGLFIGNHGVVIAADTAREVRQLYDTLANILQHYYSRNQPRHPFGKPVIPIPSRQEIDRQVVGLSPMLRGLLSDSVSLPVVTFMDAEIVLELVNSPMGRKMAVSGSFTPDQVVYCNAFPLWLPREHTRTLSVNAMRPLFASYRERFGYDPKIILAEGLGLFAIGNHLAEAKTAGALYEDATQIAKHSFAFGGPRFLSRNQWRFIENWEVERYRRKVASDSITTAQGRVRGKVAIVTGAAQGLGEGIARDLVTEGASVLISDVNIEKARVVASDIAAKHGEGRALAVPVNVTDERSVIEMIAATVRAYGGIDLLVSNAGILRAGSVKAMSLADFELVTRVNYTGYFLCVKHVAPVMAAQHAANPAYMADIIQINSKSGLQGSNRNAAYSGSKFGGIGLTQSFALELIEDGIKVNAVCPGNFFDGPLWSDPENGLFVQYLRAGKVPGAKTIADVRKAYEAKVPMGRGLSVKDIMCAIYAIIEQEYETGQAVPVTGGQIMG